MLLFTGLAYFFFFFFGPLMVSFMKSIEIQRPNHDKLFLSLLKEAKECSKELSENKECVHVHRRICLISTIFSFNETYVWSDFYFYFLIQPLCWKRVQFCKSSDLILPPTFASFSTYNVSQLVRDYFLNSQQGVDQFYQ